MHRGHHRILCLNLSHNEHECNHRPAIDIDLHIIHNDLNNDLISKDDISEAPNKHR